jgi:glutathione S-transferase
VDQQLAGKQYLMGDQFSVTDAYLFTVAGWGQYVGVDIKPLANLSAYMARVAARGARSDEGRRAAEIAAGLKRPCPVSPRLS